MEDVLDLYAEDYNEQLPVVGFDETSKQLIAETKLPLPARAGVKGFRFHDLRHEYGSRLGDADVN